ncbi:ScbA/BarX family gamma-butyrolactone biosynthesis protein [Streptomyces pharetrae]|uniref:ScbA/BarX family gamma-butyrolactone biosynthesis protein n=1 Tax=Streptomyces pharetrae TaxID=291370 RepID=UPI0033649E82
MSRSITSGLSYSATVSRRLVHRAAVCEVFLTDTERESDERFLVAAQLPRVHSYYSDHLTTPAAYDPLLLLEVFRQTSILVAHEHLGAPHDNKFTFNDGDLAVLDQEALVIGDRPGHALLDVEVVTEKRRHGELVGVTLRMSMALDGRDAATMTMAIQWMPPHAWQGLRERGRAALGLTAEPASGHPGTRRLPPASVGRHSPQNVVLSESAVIGRELVAKVLVDQSHPALFDHPLDHIPGALLFEAYRQTALHAAHELLGLSPHRLTLVRCVAAFTRFGEFELPTTCRAELVEGPDRAGVTFRLQTSQDGVVVSTAEIGLQCAAPLGSRLVPESAPLALQAG